MYLNAMRRVAQEKGISMEEMAQSIGASYKNLRRDNVDLQSRRQYQSGKSCASHYLSRPIE